MAWWMAIPAVISAVGALSQSSQQRGNAAAAGGWNRYNAQMGFNVTIGNIRSQMMLSRANAALAMRAGSAQAGIIAGQATYNARMIKATTLYNDQLLEEELRLMWDGMELEIEQIEDQRAVERGGMIANQAASGTVIGTGSNASAIIDQKTQEAMDQFIVRHGADIQAAKIANARAQGLWQGEAQIQKVLYEGRLGAASAMNGAIAQAAGGLANAAIGGMAELTSAGYALQAGLAGGNIAQSQGMQQAQNSLFNGLFSAAGQGVAAYYGSRVPTVGSSMSAASSNYFTSTGSYRGQNLISNSPGAYQAGGSLVF